MQLVGWVQCLGYDVIFDTVTLAEQHWGTEVLFVHLIGACALIVTASDQAAGEYRRIGLCRGEYGTIVTRTQEDTLVWEVGVITLI